MKRNALVSAGVLFVLLAVVGVVAQRPDRQLTPTSFGTGPIGYQAAYEVLSESGLPVGRNLARFTDLPEGATVWWIEPASVCGAAAEQTSSASSRAAWSGEDWLRRGGTAVIFLPLGTAASACAGEALPSRTLLSGALPTPGPTPGTEGTPASEVEEEEQAAPVQLFSERIDATPQSVSGTRLPTPRRLTMPRLAAFADAGDWTLAAAVGDHPFILERRIGAGRLVVVGDTQFASNGWLDHGDSAPLLMDLARVYGTPLFDERDHGFGLSGSTSAYLWRSPARAAFIGLAVLGLVFTWWGAALPPRSAGGDDRLEPTLERYVGSLATLYARTGDYAAVGERYGDFILAQLRRQSGLTQDTPVEIVVDRLQRQGRIDAAEARLLRQPATVASPAELRQHTQRLDEILRKASK